MATIGVHVVKEDVAMYQYKDEPGPGCRGDMHTSRNDMQNTGAAERRIRADRKRSLEESSSRSGRAICTWASLLVCPPRCLVATVWHSLSNRCVLALSLACHPHEQLLQIEGVLQSSLFNILTHPSPLASYSRGLQCKPKFAPQYRALAGMISIDSMNY